MKNNPTQEAPWIVVGGGMVGAAMALSLADSGRRVIVLEPQLENMLALATAAEYAATPYDLRISAVTADNVALLEDLEVWSQVAALRAQPFCQLGVREGAGEWLEFGADTDSKSRDKNSQPLGFMVENRLLQACLLHRLQKTPGVELRAASFAGLDSQSGQPVVLIKVGDEAIERVPYSWLIVADGAQSKARDALGMGTIGNRYHERCLLSIVQLQQPAGERTWQTFAGREVHALLPLCDNQACLIVYADSPVIQSWERSQTEVATVLAERFHEQLGEFELLRHASFPLQHQQAIRTFSSSQRALLIGDAAHAIHPLAGQGVNLGLRDVAALHELLQQFTDEDGALSSKLARALQRRQLANVAMGQGLDAVSRIFRSTNPLLQMTRRLGFLGIQVAPGLRQLLGKFAGQR
ncbi:MAG: FAD-dependent monooxygenase [Gammaproteobacteria bacterium]|nr:FAD-dependent monooxygenase [Gammaproteobacteria bacterium]